ncbi:hypothetical protein M3212_09590 [Alkalihalobacillus oceani]|uniref:hypothetical protein n=1 Tax=Halalkalibacter oceani TaxID=1653776 RepID=UPI00203B3E74|nr:hypothetical protein [Halalkalibacter oceani]MCM3761036.1 hypothetical protein [Halalkalibacter oceani]
MNINKIIFTALQDVGVPVSFQHYRGQTFPYITFFTYLEKGEQHADDKEKITGYYVQVDIWSKDDYTDLASTVHQKMLAAGFTKRSYYDFYETDVGVYHKAMRFQFNKEVL